MLAFTGIVDGDAVDEKVHALPGWPVPDDLRANAGIPFVGMVVGDLIVAGGECARRRAETR